MQKNKLNIQINKPISEVFEFTTNPNNTPSWIDWMEIEKTNEWPIKMGSIYKNQNKNGKWFESFVTALIENQVFELTSSDEIYHVRYKYRSIDNNTTEMEYYEWVDSGKLNHPFTIKVLKKLKHVLEN